MKIKDLEKAMADGVTVAYTAYNRDDIQFASEVRIINPRATYRSTNGERWGSHEAQGVAIEFVNTREPKRDIVAYNKIIGTWAEISERQAERVKYQREREDQQANSQATAEQQAAQVKEWLEAAGYAVKFNDVEVEGIGGYHNGRHYRAPYAYGVRLSTRAMAAVLGKLGV